MDLENQMKNNSFIIKGDIIYSKSKKELSWYKDGYLVCEDGVSRGVYGDLSDIPESCRTLPIEDHTGKLVIPGMTDLHLHAPQYGFRGLWGDMELLDWLNIHTFPEEARYADSAYAKEAYAIFVDDMLHTATTSFAAFSSIHVPATELLMDLTEESGLRAYIGKVNMDRNSPDELREITEGSFSETLRWLSDVKERNYQNVRPILTPRFIPSCTDELMEKLGELIRETGLPLQSHLSENRSEISWVKELCPWSQSYGDAYEHFHCLGDLGNRTIMAHCVWSGDQEVELMKKNGVFIAHSPSSNNNIASGIAPVRKYLEKGLNVGLATDMSGGTTASILRIMTDALTASKLYWRLVDETAKPLTFPEVFYLGTVGGGAFFGKTGSFEEGYAFDAVVLSDEDLRTPLKDRLDPAERLERYCYVAGERPVDHKYVSGRKLL